MKKKILCILSSMNSGGAETFMMKILNTIDRESVQLDFCVNVSENFYQKDIECLGSKLFIIPSKSEKPIEHFKLLKDIVKREKYKTVIRVNEHSLSTLDLLASKFGGAKKLVMRSSNASSESKKSIILHKLFKPLAMTIPTIKIAPSKKAAEYSFGKRNVEEGKVIILKNGLDTNKFAFSLKNRNLIRQSLNIKNETVIGHIGRFNNQKNHPFLVDVFYEFHQKNPNSILLLIGEGNQKEYIEKKVEKLNLSHSVKFLGLKTNIPELLSAMDLFLFPSFYEGMPNTVIEAQTNGVPCLISDTITKEVKVTDLVEFESLEHSSLKWAKSMNKMLNEKNSLSRNDYQKIMKEQGYDIEEVTNIFLKKIVN